MGKHPLNRQLLFGYSHNMIELDYGGQVYRYKGVDMYLLGERCISKDFSGLWSRFEVDEYSFFESKGSESFEEELEWLLGARYKEYGCRLWVKEQ